MKIALIGYGKMGHAIEEQARQKGHQIVCTIDKDDPWPEKLEAEVAVEFTTPQTAADNVERCLMMGMPVVCGTTGWYAHYDRLAELCRHRGGRMLCATNFSIGMNIMFALNEHLAQLMAGRTDYRCSITETHHIHKLDAPSGTALTLQGQIVESGKRDVESVPITSYREGEVPGTHTVVYESPEDTIYLTHEAHSRAGLAHGALIAAEWLVTAVPGVYTMKDLFK